MPSRSLLFVSFLLLLSLSSACSKTPDTTEGADKESQLEEKITNVRVIQVKPGRFVSSLELTGTAEPWKSVTIAAELGGKLDSLRLSEGQTVKLGQMVAGVDSKALLAQRDQATANLRLNQVQEKWQQRNQTKQVSLAESQYDNTASTFARQQKLYQEQVVSAQNFDNAKSNLTNAKLQLEVQQISRSSTVEVNQEQTKVAASNLRLANVNLAKAIVTSPISGYVNRVHVEQGEFVSPGAPIADVVQISPIKVVVGIPEREIGSIQLGQAVNVSFDAIPDVKIKGFVKFIAATADGASKTFPVQVQVPNPDLKIKGGMIGRVSFERDRESQAIVIPQDTVIDQADGRYVFIEEDGKAKKVKVELGQRDGSQVVVTSGLKGGDSVISFGQRNLINGQKINVQERRQQGLPTPDASGAPSTGSESTETPGSDSPGTNQTNSGSPSSTESAVPLGNSLTPASLAPSTAVSARPSVLEKPSGLASPSAIATVAPATRASLSPAPPLPTVSPPTSQDFKQSWISNDLRGL